MCVQLDIMDIMVFAIFINALLSLQLYLQMIQQIFAKLNVL
jgi:hypothetical protein